MTAAPDVVQLDAADFSRRAAAALVERERDRLPDLSRCCVLLPNLNAAADFARHLKAAAGVPVLLLPRLTVLPELARGAAARPDVEPEARREAGLYQALKAHDWFRREELWERCGELLALCDEMTRHGARLSPDLEAFTAWLEQAYGAGASEPFSFEARLVHGAWSALLPRDDGPVDAATAYLLGLAALAAAADQPLYAVGLEDLTRAEEEFLTQYSRRQPVTRFVAEPRDDLTCLLANAWAEPDNAPPLRERALSWSSRCAASPLAGRVCAFGATDLEQEAQAVTLLIRRWLAEGRQRIALVAQDRLVARRVRALLERAAILVEDESGWLLSTTSASTVVMRWLDALASDFYYRDLLDFLKSPFSLAGWEGRREALFALEQGVRRHGIVSGLGHYQRLAEEAEAGPVLAQLVGRLAQARHRFGREARPLAAWQQALRESLDILGAWPALARDLAGEQLLMLFERLENDLAGDRTTYTQAEWRRWLTRQLESATFRDMAVESPVVFTHLAATRMRHFDGVVVAGADARQLPGRAGDSAWFNQSVRRQLGLPTEAERRQALVRDLLRLVADSGAVCFTWQAFVNGEPNAPSPWIERLQVFHRLAHGKALETGGLGELAARQHADIPAGAATPRPAPGVPGDRVPGTISASGYNSLMTCPYQYFARHVLKLGELDEVAEGMEKRDYGEHVHEILHRFHRRHPQLLGQDRALLAEALRDITREVFARSVEASYLAHAWRLRWETLIPGYLDWQIAREQAGWHWREGEAERILDLPLPEGKSLRLKGRLDRIDQDAEGRLGVIDYKTQSKKTLADKLKVPGEDVQLPVYAALARGKVGEALFLGLDKDSVEALPFKEDIADAVDDAVERLALLFGRIHEGAPLPAQGAETACAWCEMGGLCRRDHWEEA
jgi:ATP-dependent helicase/nuclease subunit B